MNYRTKKRQRQFDADVEEAATTAAFDTARIRPTPLVESGRADVDRTQHRLKAKADAAATPKPQPLPKGLAVPRRKVLKSLSDRRAT